MGIQAQTIPMQHSTLIQMPRLTSVSVCKPGVNISATCVMLGNMLTGNVQAFYLANKGHSNNTGDANAVNRQTLRVTREFKKGRLQATDNKSHN